MCWIFIFTCSATVCGVLHLSDFWSVPGLFGDFLGSLGLRETVRDSLGISGPEGQRDLCQGRAGSQGFEAIWQNWGAAYYNFPHSGLIQGFFDGHPIVNWRHENLMRLFFRALRPYMKSGWKGKEPRLPRDRKKKTTCSFCHLDFVKGFWCFGRKISAKISAKLS